MVKIPPGPSGVQGFALFVRSLRDPISVAAELKRRYGDIVRLDAGPISAVLLNHPELVEEVLGPKNAMFGKDKRYRSTPRLLGDGILTSDGELWRQQRRVAQPAFDVEHLATYGGVMAECAEKIVRSWRPGEVRDIHADMMAITLAVTGKALFGADMTDVASEMASSFMVLLEHWNHRATNPLALPEVVPTRRNRQFNRAIGRLEDLLATLVRERLQSGEDRDDLLAKMLHARKGQPGPPVDKQLRDDFVTIVLAGYETSANSISWTLHLLARHPQIEARVAEELRAALSGRAPGQADMPKLRYFEAVLTESLRLYPPVWGFGREVIQDCEVGGYPMSRGTQLFICPYLNHRDARFFREPEVFEPDRWMGGLAKQLPPGAYIPFGRGPRMCLGRSFALMEGIIVLSVVLQRYRLEPDPTSSVTPRSGITLRPVPGLLMKVLPREPAVA
jgi:cytochrome P450